MARLNVDWGAWIAPATPYPSPLLLAILSWAQLEIALPHHTNSNHLRRSLTRRDFLHRTAAMSLSVSGMAAFLAACSPPQRAARNEGPMLARPDSPVTLPIRDDNPPLEDGLEPESGATLRIYNWEEYLRPRIIEEFATKYGVAVEISTFSDMDDALATLRSGRTFDVFFHRIDVISRLVEEKLLRPLNHSYIPNFSANVWTVYQNPFYDQGARYGVPYTVYTTGIMWRTDRVDEDIAALSNPYEIFWDERYKHRIHLLDDYREAISMVLLKNGVTDLNTADGEALATVADDLALLAENVGSVDIDAYTDVPSGDAWIHQAWAGDAIASPYYFAKGEDPSVIRYWFPPDGRGAVANDCMGILRGSPNPVLAHHFINYLLDSDVATANFAWNGYQPPQVGLKPPLLVAEGYIPGYLGNTIVRRESFNSGFMQLELAPRVDQQWHRVWGEFNDRA
jgi:spermidine/putrescine transport system substrate-binding protein